LEIQSAIQKLRLELPKSDTSSFSFEKRNKETQTAADDAIDLDDLLNRFDELKGKGLDDKTEEGQELRALIRTYIEREGLPVRITRITSNVVAALRGGGLHYHSDESQRLQRYTRFRTSCARHLAKLLVVCSAFIFAFFIESYCFLYQLLRCSAF
jgi:type I site-specific restriction-modification system R (restriction) subunit